MADLASNPTDLADETVDANDPNMSAPDPGDGNLLGELARAMHAAATSQYQRLNTELERQRAEQVESIAERASTASENLKADSEADIGAIDAWAKNETEKIKLERLRRIDGRREQLAAQLERQDTIKEREVFAIEVAIDAHRNEVDLFFGRMERETDPSAIARVAATMPPFPSLDDVAEQARRSAAAEFASLDGGVEATTREATPRVIATTGTASTTESTSGAESIEGVDTTTTTTTANADAPTAAAGSPESETPAGSSTTAEPSSTAEATAETTEAVTATDANAETGANDATEPELERAAAVSESRLKAVMDPDASSDEGKTTQPWEEPHAVSVAAGTGPADEEPAPMSVGSTLLRTVRSIRPMAGRQDKDSDEGGASR